MNRAAMHTVVLLALAAAACAPAESPEPEVDIAAETAALREAAERYQDLAAAGDAEGLSAMYLSNAVSYPPGEPAVEGMAAIREYSEGFASLEGFEASFELTDVVVGAGGDMGYTVADASLSFVSPDGQPVSENIRDIHVWRKDPAGAWRVAVDVWNSPEPPPEM